jgi:hypothetical protein
MQAVIGPLGDRLREALGGDKGKWEKQDIEFACEG